VRHKFNAVALHGDLDQTSRTAALDAFRSGEAKLLIASDVAARGLDIPDVSHVFNFDVPHHADDYVHRIGRTGRAGKSGQTFMITTPADTRNLDKVLKLIGKAPEEIELDLDWANIKDEPRSGRGAERGGRGGRSGPSSRDRDRRPRPVPVHGEVASMTPFDPATAPPPEPAAPRAERPERGGRTRGRRGRSEDRPAPKTAPEAAAPAEAKAAPPAREPEAPRERPERERPQRAAPEHAAQDRGPPDRQRRDRPDHRQDHRSDNGRDDRDDGVVGFGRDVPAFLSRPPPPRSED